MAHLEHVVGGAVDDPEHPPQPVARERLLERVDDRDGAAHRRLELEVDVGRVGRVEELLAAAGEQLLVGGDHRLAAAEGVQHEGAGWLDAAHDLDHHVDLGVGHDRRRVVGQPARFDRGVALLAQVTHGHPAQLDRGAGAVAQLPGVLAQQPGDARADRPAAEHPHPDRLTHRDPAYLPCLQRRAHLA